MKLNDQQLTKLLDDINAELMQHSREFIRRFMSQVRCGHANECPNANGCLHAKDDRSHSGRRNCTDCSQPTRT